MGMRGPGGHGGSQYYKYIPLLQNHTAHQGLTIRDDMHEADGSWSCPNSQPAGVTTIALVAKIQSCPKRHWQTRDINTAIQ